MRESLECSPRGVASQEDGYLLVTPLLEDFTDARMGLVCGSQAFHAHLVDRAVNHVVGQLSVQYEGWVGLGAGHGEDWSTDEVGLDVVGQIGDSSGCPRPLHGRDI